jgi:hypothetical protein
MPVGSGQVIRKKMNYFGILNTEDLELDPDP